MKTKPKRNQTNENPRCPDSCATIEVQEAGALYRTQKMFVLVNRETNQDSQYYERTGAIQFLIKHPEIKNFSVQYAEVPIYLL